MEKGITSIHDQGIINAKLISKHIPETRSINLVIDGGSKIIKGLCEGFNIGSRNYQMRYASDLQLVILSNSSAERRLVAILNWLKKE